MFDLRKKIISVAVGAGALTLWHLYPQSKFAEFLESQGVSLGVVETTFLGYGTVLVFTGVAIWLLIGRGRNST